MNASSLELHHSSSWHFFILSVFLLSNYHLVCLFISVRNWSWHGVAGWYGNSCWEIWHHYSV